MIWQVSRIDRTGRRIWESKGVAMRNRFEFLEWIRACCKSAGFADRARRQTDIPAIWDSATDGTEFLVRNYSPLGEIDALRFARVNADLERIAAG